MPEIRIPVREFDRDVTLAVARAADGHHFAFYFFSCDFIFELKNFVQHHDLLQLDRCAVPAQKFHRREMQRIQVAQTVQTQVDGEAQSAALL